MWKSCIAFFLISQQLIGSTIPQYEIESVESTLITLNNDAVFEVEGLEFEAILNWSGNDVLIISNGVAKLPFRFGFWRDHFLSFQLFSIQNLSKGNSVAASLISPPSPSSTTITAIDYVLKQVALSNGTIWEICELDHSKLKFWEANDTVLVGKNKTIKCLSFDAIIVNATRQIDAMAKQL